MNKYMQMANDLAKENLIKNDGGPFGAVIVKDDTVVGKGKNMVLVHNDPTAHAEIMAIRDASKMLGTYDLKGCILYTSCYPCPMCLSAIIWANIETVYYGNTKEDAKKIGFRDDFLYSYLKNMEQENSLLKLIPIDRDYTIQAFEQYQKEKKVIY